ncbi:MAG: hypothetical protein ABJA16_05020 [Nakamurella sp.]
MTAATTSVATSPGPPDRGAAPPFPRLLWTEWQRLWARRFTKALLAVSVLGYLAAMVFLWSAHAQPTPQDIAEATVARDQNIADIRASVDQCIAGGETSGFCGVAPTPADYPIDYFLASSPFTPTQVPYYSLAVGVAVAMAGFILGATFIGAEWSSRNLVAWLFYEPRRLRLLGAKLLALIGAVTVLALVAQAIWLLSAQLLITQRGVPVSSLGSDADQFWPTALQESLRAALLVVPVTLLGFGLANLLRNTAAAFGVAFVFFVIVEQVAAGISPGLQPYQFTVSVAAWVTSGGITVFGDAVYDAQAGYVSPAPIPVSNLHGGVVLMVYAAVVLGVSVWLFRRRDVV